MSEPVGVPASTAGHDGEQPERLQLGPALAATVRRGSARLEVQLTGTLDRAGVRRLQVALLELTPEQRHAALTTDVVVDVAGIDHVDVEGLRTLVGLDTALNARGLTVLLHGPRPEMLLLIARAGLLRDLPVEQP